MMLQSARMQLSSAERRWLAWLGRHGKLSLGWSCWINRSRYALMEQAFESIANTRIRLMHRWVESQWRHLQAVAARVEQADSDLNTLLARQCPAHERLLRIVCGQLGR